MILSNSENRETLVGYVPLTHYFCQKNDLTIFRVFEKRFAEKKIGANVINHPELIKMFSADELVYHLTDADIAMIKLIYQRIKTFP